MHIDQIKIIILDYRKFDIHDKYEEIRDLNKKIDKKII